jgi:hypothetical protein
MLRAGPTYVAFTHIQNSKKLNFPEGNCGVIFMSIHKVAFLLGTVLES